MKLKNSTLIFIIVFVLALGIYYYRNPIIIKIFTTSIDKETKNNIVSPYYINYNYKFVTQTDNFIPESKQDILNIFYSILNRGYDEFTFYCHPDYQNCVSDVTTLAKDNSVLSNINNFVHPYNSYQSLEIKSTSLGKITVKINKMYTTLEINEINAVVDDILKTKVKDSMTQKEKIKVIHDYIVNTTSYDLEKGSKDEFGVVNYEKASNKATGPAINHYALCGGYTDFMMIFLDKLNIPSFKVSSKDHIWNAVFLDNSWYHLDLTWDDPITSNKENVLLHDYFLITDKKLKENKNEEHNYDDAYFSELKGS